MVPGTLREDLRVSEVASASYERRRPETTVLYRIIQEHLETFLEQARRHDGKGLPRYVEGELRAFLKCGILAHGFLHAQCKACGQELVVAFSCKRRGVCPSCNARLMCNRAAHLVDRVFPDVPVRQWVLSVPFELRLLLARRADAFGALLRILAEEVERLQHRRAAARGIRASVTAGVSFPQRFGGSLNLNTHVHAVFCDGVFEFDGAEHGVFHALPAPDAARLTLVCENTAARLFRWLRRRGLAAEEVGPSSNEARTVSAVEACDRGALGIGELTSIDDEGETIGRDEDAHLPQPRGRRSRFVGEAAGFHLHAGVAVPAENRLGRELLLRYCARPPLSLERLSILDDGRIAYRIKKPWRKDRTHRVMTPLEFMSRLVALIPPPRTPLIHFHGAFAPRFKRRTLVVPVDSVTRLMSDCGERAQASNEPPARALPRTAEPTAPTAASAPTNSSRAAARSASSAAIFVDAALKSGPWRIDWATLLFRVYDVDALACPCGGRLSFIDLVIEKADARDILLRLGLPADAPKPIRPEQAREIDNLPPPDW
jgi:hypothetical protein